ncbi:MAG: hypothetical protein IJA67_11015, partial [Oscillospiraceae bacterium]|nr:hypothetical protein [Oscillospiraceae bacterium]
NASQNFVRKDETKSNLFFAPACTKRKIQIGLQVWNLFAECGQIMRAAPHVYVGSANALTAWRWLQTCLPIA